MSAKSSRQRATNEVRTGLRELRGQLTQLNHQVGRLLELKDVDLECLDLLDRGGPASPTALARLAGLHPATMTGVVDRLEQQGWVSRERDPDDRRGVVVRAQPARGVDLLRPYSGMNAAITRICGEYEVEQLELVAGLLGRLAEAGRRCAEELAATHKRPGTP